MLLKLTVSSNPLGYDTPTKHASLYTYNTLHLSEHHNEMLTGAVIQNNPETLQLTLKDASLENINSFYKLYEASGSSFKIKNFENFNKYNFDNILQKARSDKLVTRNLINDFNSLCFDKKV
jgi:hypothetical protein